jgi:hypothetical protein
MMGHRKESGVARGRSLGRGEELSICIVRVLGARYLLACRWRLEVRANNTNLVWYGHARDIRFRQLPSHLINHFFTSPSPMLSLQVGDLLHIQTLFSL